MTTHTCGYCYGNQDAMSRTRAAMFATIRAEPTATNVGLAKVYGVVLRTAVKWRHEGERRGCLSPRTDFSRSFGQTPRPLPTRMAPPLPPLPKMKRRPAWPIGTVWTTAETARAA